MHSYAIHNHDRTKLGRIIATVAILFAGGISALLAKADLNGFAFGAVSTGFVYFLLDFVFTRFGWKIKLLKFPNLSGKWLVEGKTLDENSQIKFEWNATLTIDQTWKEILISLKTKKSQSNSYTAHLFKRNEGWFLNYSYRNEPNVDQYNELQQHKGMCELVFDLDNKSASGSYFNSSGRKTFGTMTLQRIQE